MNIINTPKVGTSDIEVKLSEILKHDQIVSVGDIICAIETSKSTFEVESLYEGYVYILHQLGDSFEIGSPLAIISEKRLDKQEIEKNISQKQLNFESKKISKITKKAEILIEKYNVDISLINKELITEKDIENLLNLNNDELDNIRFTKNDIVIIGIGGHASMCIDILLQNGEYNIVGFVDDNITIDNRYSLKFLGNISRIEKFSKFGLEQVVLGIGFLGDLKKRQKVYEYLCQYVKIPTIIHKKAIVENSSIINSGCQIMAGAIIGSNVIIDKNCIINSGAIISHDSQIAKGSHITPGATLAGNVMIGECVTVGMCATIYMGLSISDYTIVPNGKSIIESY